MSRLSIINDALVLAGEQPRLTEFDGSDEWTVAETGYRAAVALTLDEHAWSFTTKTAPLARIAESPTPKYEHAYQLPGDCLHLKAVFFAGRPLADYEIVDGKVCCPFDGEISATYVREPPTDQWPAGFVAIVRTRTEAAILRALAEDRDAATARERDALRLLETARTRSDQQTPGRAIFVSRVVSRRRGAVHHRG